MAASKAGNASIWPKVRKALLLNAAAAAAAAGRGGLLKQFAGRGFGKRATPAQKTQVVQKLRRKHSLDILLSIAQLSRAAFYYHLKRMDCPDKYEAAKAEIAAIYHENKGRYGYHRITTELYSISKEVEKMLSERIYKFRRKSGLSQEQLAEKIGVSRQAISKWESGTSTPELEKLLALSECFNITLDDLVKEKTINQGTMEAPPKVEDAKVSKAIEMKVGIGLCLIGAVCLILFGVLMVMSPSATEQLNTASTITLSESGALPILCVFSMVVGLVLILRKK